MAARNYLVARSIFRTNQQRLDLLDPNVTQSALIALLIDVQHAATKVNGYLLFTMLRTGHHNDGPHGHAGGYAADGWLLSAFRDGAYGYDGTPRFTQWLADFSRSPWGRQYGLVGPCDTPVNQAALYGKGFHDDGDEHVHWGAVI